jgi:hypothetical protein
MLVHREGEFQFRADAINTRDENWLLIFFDVERKKTAETADFSEHFTSVRGGEELRQSGFHFVAKINVHSGGGVSFLFHAAGINREQAACAKLIFGGSSRDGREGGEGKAEELEI